MSIYERANWPSPDKNPLIALLNRGEEWISSIEVDEALGGGDDNMRVSDKWPLLLEQIGADQTALDGHGRHYTRKALVVIAMRSETPNAAAFRDWLSSQVANAAAETLPY